VKALSKLLTFIQMSNGIIAVINAQASANSGENKSSDE
jgi:hypothetical protein